MELAGLEPGDLLGAITRTARQPGAHLRQESSTWRCAPELLETLA
jgi:hypothetical protein